MKLAILSALHELYKLSPTPYRTFRMALSTCPPAMAAFTAAFPLPPGDSAAARDGGPFHRKENGSSRLGFSRPSWIVRTEAAGELLSMGSINHLSLSLFLGSPQPRKLKINFNGSLEANGEAGVIRNPEGRILAAGASPVPENTSPILDLQAALEGIRLAHHLLNANRIWLEQSNVKKERRKKPDPPCVVCNGSGRNDCHYCQGRGRTNCVHQVMLPKGEWPKWCNVCGGSGLGYCNRCLGTGEYRDIMGFHFMKINGNSS